MTNLKNKEDLFEELGQTIDQLDDLAHAVFIPVEPAIHVASLKCLLPEKIQKLKELFIDITGEDPWDITIKIPTNAKS